MNWLERKRQKLLKEQGSEVSKIVTMVNQSGLGDRTLAIDELTSLYGRLDLDIPRFEIEFFSDAEIVDQIVKSKPLLSDLILMRDIEKVQQERKSKDWNFSKHPN